MSDICQQLTRIADALEALVSLQHQMLQLELAPAPAPEPTPAPEETPGCPHPPDQRASFGMTNGQEEWECRLCQYRTPTTS